MTVTVELVRRDDWTQQKVTCVSVTQYKLLFMFFD